jgi:enamine deaminase RidA (YjgF/YER057c/UK114 family)
MPETVRLIRSPELFDAEYAYAATVEPGSRLIFLAGACPLEADGTTAAPGDYAGQAASCIETLTVALRSAGATIEDVVSTRVLVASALRTDLTAVWRVVRAAFGDHDVPSTLLGVTVLGYEHQLVEIEAVAAIRD